MDTVEKIEKLKALLDSGAISKEEFENLQRKIIVESLDLSPDLAKKPASSEEKVNTARKAHAVGVSFLALEALLVMVAMIVGLYANAKTQLIMVFIASFFGLIYIPFGINLGAKKKDGIVWIIVLMLSFVAVSSFIWITCWFGSLIHYF